MYSWKIGIGGEKAAKVEARELLGNCRKWEKVPGI